MALKNLLFFFILFFHLNPHFSSAQSPVKAAYWFSGSEFPLSDINSPLFTHCYCAFAALNPTTNQLTIASADAARFSTFTQTVQQKNPSLKTLLSIGGGSSRAADFASMASQQSSRKSFIDSSIKLARDNRFHGLDLDWEFPQSASDMSNMGLLFQEWRAAVQSESSASGRSPLLLAAAVPFSPMPDSLSYPVDSIGRNLDWVNVMAYDFKGPGWTPNFTGGPAALYNPSSRFSGSAGMDAWVRAGLSTTKLVLGFPFYGYAWKLKNPANHSLGSPSTGPATGAGISSDGSIGYKQIKEFVQSSGATLVFDPDTVTDYCYSGSTWIGFDDVQSIAAKVSFAKVKKLRGYFTWQISGDSNSILSRKASETWDA